MATSADILKEYLVKVGVEADYDALSKFGAIVGTIGKIAGGMAAAMSVGIGALEGFVTVAASELEDLYWATKRLKSSASDIQDFSLQMQKAGMSVESARNALESIQQLRRTNPAGNSLIGLITGQNESGKSAVDVMNDLIVRFKQLKAGGQEWLAFKFGERLGLDYRTVSDMLQAAPALEDKYAKLYKAFGVNQEEATSKAHDFMNRLRDLRAEGTVLATVLEGRLLPYADKFLGWLTKVIEQGPKSGSFFDNMSKAFSSIASAGEKIGQNLPAIASDLVNLANAAAQLIASMPPSSLEFGLVGYFLFGKKAAIILGAIGAIRDIVNAVGTRMGASDTTKALFLGIATPGAGKMLSDDVSSLTGLIAGGGSANAPPGGGKAPLGVRSNNPGNLQPGGKEAVYRTPLEGLQAMAKLLGHYASKGLTSVSAIISKYAPPGMNNTAAYIKSVARAMGVSADAKLDMSDPGTLRRLMSSMINVEQGYKPYSEDLIGQAVRSVLTATANDSLGGAARSTASPLGSAPSLSQLANSKTVIVNQGDTTVNIHNAKDSAETAKQVKRVADRSNGDLVRNFATALN